MKRLLLPLIVLSTTACDFNEIAGIWGGLTAQLVVEGVVLGVASPDDPNLDLSGTDFQPGAGFTAFLADAGSAQDLENAPITGATVDVQGAVATELGSGLYTYAGGELDYQDNATYTMSVELNGDVATADIVLPPPATVAVPAEHDPNSPMTLALSGLPFDSAFVMVMDLETRDVTFDNKPSTITEVYQFTHGSGIEDVTIPGNAFPKQGLFLVGVAGMNNTAPADLTEMNTALSAVLAGKMKLYPVCTLGAQACSMQ